MTIFHSLQKKSGQIIATSHDLTPNGGLVRELPLFQVVCGEWRVVKYYNLARKMLILGYQVTPLKTEGWDHQNPPHAIHLKKKWFGFKGARARSGP